ncbi:MAG: hypothetical protein C4547_03035 [Phycisphaerales bacterium]|nr:MAG: hypothetical protein C4547_03035 [Phycisphaerales bacterium]
MLRRTFHLPDCRLTDGDGLDRRLGELLAEFNILAIRRVPVASHGPATELLRPLLAEFGDVGDRTDRGFDIRSPDSPCGTCREPRVVFQQGDLLTVCDGDGSLYRAFGAVGADRFFIVGRNRRVVDVGSIREIDKWDALLCRNGDPSPQPRAEAPPAARRPRGPRTVFDGSM